MDKRAPQNLKFISRKRHSQTYPQKYHQNKQAILQSVELLEKRQGACTFSKIVIQFNHEGGLPMGMIFYSTQKKEKQIIAPTSKSEICQQKKTSRRWKQICILWNTRKKKVADCTFSKIMIQLNHKGELAHGYDFLFNVEKRRISKRSPTLKSETCKQKKTSI